MDLKQNPLYEDGGFSMLDTHYYGGIKKYQWVTIPLAIHGVVLKKGGEKINIVIGEDDNEPVLYITDLLPHLAAKQMGKKLSEGIEGENLNILFGSIPISDKEAKNRVKLNTLKLLNEKYGITEEDFTTAELEVVPSGRSRDVGLDRSMVMAYGHDDRICAYTSLEAIVEIENPDKTCVALFVDKEEIGSVGATGMHSRFFENTVAEVMDLAGQYNELKLRRALANSKMLSSDVSAADDPNYPGVIEKKNGAFFGKGIVITKFTGSRGKGGSNDANAEFLGQLRDIFNENGIIWQTAELGKVDEGGGGTIAYILAQYGMEVVDCGVALLSMHAPWEIASKADIYETYRAYKVFLLNA
jgi:aspartyl aminopeptidase